MSPKTVVPLTAVLALAVVGCSSEHSDRGERASTPRTASPSPSRSATSAAATPSGATASEVCEEVNAAAYSQLFDMALAVGDKNAQGAALRAQTARTYTDFAGRLTLIRPRASGRLSSALAEWASTSTAVAHYIAEKKPRSGLVIDYGPTQKPWDAAQKATEKLCGHDLPDLKQDENS